jgi:hypothetical protein
MALVFSTNNRYVGLSGNPAPNFSNAWFLLKEFMVNSAGWSIVQSAAQTLSTTSDIITDAYSGPGGMSSPTVWWVMRDPGSKRELLFYRPNAINPADYTTASYMAIAYSANDRFSTTLGLAGNPVSATNPPIASDMIWLHQPDTFTGNSPGTLAAPGAMTDNVNWGNNINYSTTWNFHVCASTTAPYPFYFWFTTQDNTASFFCMDSLADTHPLDTDDVLFYHFPVFGGINNLNYSMLRTWYKKPIHFSDRTDFANKINNKEARFLATAALYYTYDISNYGGNQFAVSVAIPRGLPTSLYSTKDDLFPIRYARNTQASYYNDILSLPPSYKGTSSFLRYLASPRNQFDTLDVSGTRDWVAVGANPIIAIPWNGALFNLA